MATKKKSVKKSPKTTPSKSSKSDAKKLSAKKSPQSTTNKSLLRFLNRRFYITSLFILIGIWLLIIWFILKDLPSPTSLGENPYAISTHIYDRNGTPLYEIYANQNRTPVKLEEIPDYMKQATIAIEDKDFYKHQGIDIIGMARGLSRFFTRGRAQGGSTITQQLVKNALLTPERSLQRKLKEIILTLAVEFMYTKDQILEMYLNQIPYGGTAYGIESAAETYFNKHAKDLTLPEATILAGLPQAPTRYSPYGSDPNAYKNRQKAVIGRMQEDGYLSPEQAQQTAETTVEFATPTNLIHAPHFVLWIKELLVEKYGEAMVETGGLRVTTSLDLSLQETAEATVSAEVAKLEKYDASNGAAIVTNPLNGQVLAFVGSADYYNDDIDGKVSIPLRYRQPGSSIKPINYTFAFHQYGYSPGNIAGDVPTCFTSAGSKPYCPRNYDGRFHGPATIRQSLSNSYNIPAVKLLARNGVVNFINFAKELGITGWDDPSRYGLSLTLGGGEVRMVDMAVAYSSIANLGVKVPLHPILKVTDYTGKVLEELNCNGIDPTNLIESDAEQAFSPDCQATRVMPPGPPYLTTSIMTDQNARASTFGSTLNISKHPDVAVKTGTTNDLKDNWTIGFTHERMVLVWVGNNDNTPMNRIASGITGAAPIWRGIISTTLADIEPIQLNPPAGIYGTQICALTGQLPVEGCPTSFDFYPENSRPQEATPITRPWPIDKTTGGPSRPDTPPENIEMQDKQIVFDILGNPICLDCPMETQGHTVNYPLPQQTNTGPLTTNNAETEYVYDYTEPTPQTQ